MSFYSCWRHKKTGAFFFS
ncbi:hypothetical protein CIB84_017360 [Bambusicola thoracicus]|uniref:Uncharacterized protein n=1 Tax=Bambusicola thoracicus TaxID=9083 RepID=A0A2P4S434_BAMTH|nr:hypothetical protein CIB84_017360 [Bambusicola thoracicus]